MSLRSFFLLGAVSLVVACGGPRAETAPGTTGPLAYFDLKGFLNDQRTYLESVSPAVTKTVRTDDGPAQTQHLTRINWERELAFFYDADLNKPALRGSYTTTQANLPDGRRRLTYVRRPGEPGAIRELVVETGSAGEVQRVHVKQDDHNLLFASSRTMTLSCDPAPQHNRLVEYAVAGRQKLLFFDETRYEVRGEAE